MTLDQWLDRSSGYTLTLPAGTDTRVYTSDPKLDRDTRVTITLDHAGIRRMIARALHNKTKRCFSGAITVKVETNG